MQVSRGTLVFLHGEDPRAGERWERAVSRFSRLYRCLVPDFPGFGRSFSSLGHELSFLAQLEFTYLLLYKLLGEGEKALLIGHDFGGAIAQACAIFAPEKVASLVLFQPRSKISFAMMRR